MFLTWKDEAGGIVSPGGFPQANKILSGASAEEVLFQNLGLLVASVGNTDVLTDLH